ncbi:MAG: multidrug resistance protein D [Pelotomaculum sp. PtaB.Bin013]|uniref:MFS transporter n=1 Tax=Pelotomaculum isophthalicicum JI TaxID=947010 RepID=A0A9X4H6H3_9FIRM|nr:MFS transporter [Pelotomaculum isophthalicicum]MDF9408888.1 MFS transporter [Pelotomaculum isophthalicicum JI]OPX86066.1 MAG: multidrug resistance protein D [Pelotomaculum sp. PtaB.Bin013]
MHKPKQNKFEFKWSGLEQRLKRLLLVILLFTIANSSNQFLILRASDAGVPTTGVLLLYLVFYSVSSLSAYPAGHLSDRLGRKGLLVSGYLLYSVVYLGFVQSNSWYWLLFALYGIYTGLTKGVEKALVADVAPQNLKASALGMYSMIVGIGLLPASLLTGWLWNEFGAAVPFYFNSGR